MKGFAQLSTFGSGMPVLVVKLTMLSRIMWFRCRGHWLRSLQHWVLLHLYEYALGICGKAWVFDLEPWPPISSSSVLVSGDLGFLRVICAFYADLRCTDKVGNLP